MDPLFSRLPKTQQPILRIGGNQILMWMMRYAKNLLFMNLKVITIFKYKIKVMEEVAKAMDRLTGRVLSNLPPLMTLKQ